MLKNAARLARLRAENFVKDRVDYGLVQTDFTKDWRKQHWSLQVQWPCNYDCSYCIQGFGIGGGRRRLPAFKMSAADRFLVMNKIAEHLDEPMDNLFIQGGEPLLFPEIKKLLSEIQIFKKVTVISNLALDISPLLEVGRERDDLQLEVIGSYHHEFAELDEYLDKAKRLQDAGIWGWGDFVDFDFSKSLGYLEKFDEAGIQCKPFRFVGEKDGKVYPKKATDACGGHQVETVDCFMTYVLIAPDAKVYNCHSKMYRNSGHLCTLEEFPKGFDTGYTRCEEFGLCQPCQYQGMKVKKIPGEEPRAPELLQIQVNDT